VPGIVYAPRGAFDRFPLATEVIWLPLALVSFRPRPEEPRGLGAIGFETMVRITTRLTDRTPILLSSELLLGIELFNYLGNQFCSGQVFGSRLRAELITRVHLHYLSFEFALLDGGAQCPEVAQWSAGVGFNILNAVSARL